MLRLNRIGSLCSGYGGLDAGVRSVLGGTVAWHCENDDDASKVLAHHWPAVPNLGDLTTVSWATVEPVDVMTAGFPCQPVSHAGKRKGTDDARWLFDDICTAISRMVTRPRLLVFENVAGLLSANGGDAMARVVHGLAALGYVGSWRLVRAADAGAPHGRARVFLVATDTDSVGHERGRPARRRWDGPTDSGLTPADTDISGPQGREPAGGRFLPDGGAPADPSGDGWDEGRPEPAGIVGGPDAALSGAATPDTDSAVAARLADASEWGEDRRAIARRHSSGGIAWGPYGPAIARWERVLGRPAPAPTEPGRTGQRLSPRFVEWMLGLPAGHVTAVPGLARNAQLRILGNGVVPQQCALALRMLLGEPVAVVGASSGLLPTPAAHDSGNTPENHLRKKPGRTQVTSLQIIVDHGLLVSGGRIGGAA